MRLSLRGNEIGDPWGDRRKTRPGVRQGGVGVGEECGGEGYTGRVRTHVTPIRFST